MCVLGKVRWYHHQAQEYLMAQIQWKFISIPGQSVAFFQAVKGPGSFYFMVLPSSRGHVIYCIFLVEDKREDLATS